MKTNTKEPIQIGNCIPSEGIHDSLGGFCSCEEAQRVEEIKKNTLLEVKQ